MYTLGRDITAWMITYMAMALMTAEVQVLVSPVIVDGWEFFPHSNSNHPPIFNGYIYCAITITKMDMAINHKHL